MIYGFNIYRLISDVINTFLQANEMISEVLTKTTEAQT